MEIKKQKYLIVIAGATAVGKSTMAIQVAQHFQTEIISADSRQCYQEMTIGTAKPSVQELEMVKHHFIDCLSIQDTYSAGDYEREYLTKCDSLFQKYDVLILCGGTGLFIDALCNGLDFFPEVSPADKAHFIDLFEKEGLTSLQERLRADDPEYATVVDIQNPHRLIRALSVIKASGKKYSSFLNQPKAKRSFECIPILLEMDREALYERINLRVDQMISNGLVEEARSLFQYRKNNSLQTVGYQELFRHFEGEISLSKAIELIKRNSRRYAKRQMTWFRRNKDWTSFPSTASSQIIKFIHEAML